ncbi:MAG: ABC transporter permease [Candidatus Freyarchaeota archaeon]|nr:ABC transporter permease [Candidatus Jordarchaeia archaeon]
MVVEVAALSLTEKVQITFSQTAFMVVEEIKSLYKTKAFVIFSILMFLPMQLILISYATTNYPSLLAEVEKAFFLNGIFENGAIDAFRDIFSSAMGILTVQRGATSFTIGATTYYLNLPIIAIVTLLTCGFIAAEREKGTLPVYVSKPVYRTQLVLSKFFAFAIVSLALTSLTYSLAYFTYAATLLGPLSLFFTGVAETINLLLILIFFTWLFILAVGSITILFSSLIDRSIIVGVTSLIVLLLLSILPDMLTVFGGAGLSSYLKFFDIPGLASQLIDYHSLGFFNYYQNLWNIITMIGFFSEFIVSRMVDPTTALAIIILLIVVPLIAACIITEKREVA